MPDRIEELKSQLARLRADGLAERDRLRSVVSGYKTETYALRSELERAREALKPFVLLERDLNVGQRQVGQYVCVDVRVIDLLNAAAAFARPAPQDIRRAEAQEAGQLAAPEPRPDTSCPPPQAEERKSLAADPKCEACEGTGWYGDNGPGIKGNREYQRCDQCGQGKPAPQPSAPAEKGGGKMIIAGDEKVTCRACGWIGPLKDCTACPSIYNDCRCPKCGSTDNQHNTDYQTELFKAMKSKRRTEK